MTRRRHHHHDAGPPPAWPEGARAEPAPCLRPVDLADLARAEPPPVEYVVEGLIPRALVLLGGHGGAGKSIMALVIAAHVAAGHPFAGHAVRQGRAVFASLEDPAALIRWRLRRIAEAYHLPLAAVARNLVILDGSESDASLAVEVADLGVRSIAPTAALEELRGATAGAELLVIDNASDAFTADENNRRQVRTFMRMLSRLGHDTGAAVILLAHIDKNAARYGAGGQTYSGSTAWHNSARARLALTVEDGLVRLGMEKNNVGRLADPLFFRWTEHGVLLPASPADVPDDPPDAAGDNQSIMRCLARALHEGVIVPTARTGPSNTHAVLKTHPDLPGWALKDRGRFWAAITRLQRLGWIEAETFTTHSRNRRERWTFGPHAPETFTRAPNWSGGARDA